MAPGVQLTTVARWPVDQQLAAAVGTQAVLLAALSAVAGLGPAGWLAGIAYGSGLGWLLDAATRRAGIGTLGPAGMVTVARAVLVGAVTALVVDRLAAGATSVAILVGITTAALALDAVDGRVARRSGTVSAFGARFDLEVDAFLLLVLSAYVALLVGTWVLAIGVMRYAFVAASWTIPWMSSTVPARFSAKVVAAAQGVVFTVAAAQLLPHPVTVALISVALVALVWSFGCDVVWLWSRSPGRDAQHETLPAT